MKYEHELCHCSGRPYMEYCVVHNSECKFYNPIGSTCDDTPIILGDGVPLFSQRHPQRIPFLRRVWHKILYFLHLS
jgi:hypothetical protein